MGKAKRSTRAKVVKHSKRPARTKANVGKTDDTSALEAQLLRDPDDATWSVYADLLQQRGDPRGDVIALGQRLRAGEGALAARYAERCRAARWPRGAPFPPMCYRARFEQLVAELQHQPDVVVKTASIGSPQPGELAHWRSVAGAAWPDGMTELYSEVSRVDIEFEVDGAGSVTGAIHLPALDRVWDYARLEGELWFDFLDAASPLHRIRPIDRFVSEAYTVLYLRSDDAPGEVAYHYCGESLIPTGLTYREWLELLFRSRGVLYWIQLAVAPKKKRSTWVAEGVAPVAKMFPDFDPDAMSPTKALAEIRL